MTLTPVSDQEAQALNRYFDPARGRFVVKLLPGQSHVSRDEVMVTVVGACVVLCLRDPDSGLCGMCHFAVTYPRLPANGDEAPGAAPGADAVSGLIQDLFARDCQGLEARLFGAACLVPGECETGEISLATARDLLAAAAIPVTREDIGGPHPRKIFFLPVDGRVRIKRLRDIRNDTIARRDLRFLAGQPA